jgi:hypothetical protein
MLVDSTFGIGSQALAVMSYLNAHDGIESSRCTNTNKYLAELNAAPWYNGRERGIVFYLRSEDYVKQINIAVFEHRNSDAICALLWTGRTFNPPTLSDVPDGVYKDKWDVTHEVTYGYAANMAEWIYYQLDNFWTEHAKKSVDTVSV